MSPSYGQIQFKTKIMRKIYNSGMSDLIETTEFKKTNDDVICMLLKMISS